MYAVSDFGRVKSYKNDKIDGKILRPDKDKDGYLRVNLYRKGTIKEAKVHQLIATVFVMKSNDCTEVNHIDENKCNNYYQNLDWVTHADNIRHSLKLHPKMGKGENINSANFLMRKHWKFTV